VTPPSSLGLGDARHVLAVEPGADLPVVEVSTWQVPPAFLEECRSLAAALLAERTARHASVVAVSSASPAAGVTTVARCLARFVAESGGERVLLIAPGRGTTAQPGLTALADGAADVAHAVQRTGHERLFLLSAGPHARAISARSPPCAPCSTASSWTARRCSRRSFPRRSPVRVTAPSSCSSPTGKASSA
jgi:hypothetical protein